MLGNREIRVGIAKAGDGSTTPNTPSPIVDISKEDIYEVTEHVTKAIVGCAVTIIFARSISHALEEVIVHHGTK